MLIGRKQIEGQTLVQQGNAVLGEKRQQLLDPISDEIKDLIKRLAIDEEYDLILERQLFVLYLNPELDITSKIVVMLDNAYKERASEEAKKPEEGVVESVAGAWRYDVASVEFVRELRRIENIKAITPEELGF